MLHYKASRINPSDKKLEYTCTCNTKSPNDGFFKMCNKISKSTQWIEHLKRPEYSATIEVKAPCKGLLAPVHSIHLDLKLVTPGELGDFLFWWGSLIKTIFSYSLIIPLGDSRVLSLFLVLGAFFECHFRSRNTQLTQ